MFVMKDDLYMLGCLSNDPRLHEITDYHPTDYSISIM